MREGAVNMGRRATDKIRRATDEIKKDRKDEGIFDFNRNGSQLYDLDRVKGVKEGDLLVDGDEVLGVVFDVAGNGLTYCYRTSPIDNWIIARHISSDGRLSKGVYVRSRSIVSEGVCFDAERIHSNARRRFKGMLI